MSNDFKDIALTKLKSVTKFTIRTEGLPKCPHCNSTALDKELYSETNDAYHDISFCVDCGNYVEIVTPKVNSPVPNKNR
jgi:hypothetical protein